jgi:hypothetical protein
MSKELKIGIKTVVFDQAYASIRPGKIVSLSKYNLAS